MWFSVFVLVVLLGVLLLLLTAEPLLASNDVSVTLLDWKKKFFFSAHFRMWFSKTRPREWRYGLRVIFARWEKMLIGVGALKRIWGRYTKQ